MLRAAGSNVMSFRLTLAWPLVAETAVAVPPAEDALVQVSPHDAEISPLPASFRCRNYWRALAGAVACDSGDSPTAGIPVRVLVVLAHLHAIGEDQPSAAEETAAPSSTTRTALGGTITTGVRA
jgi:hypothetical protein